MVPAYGYSCAARGGPRGAGQHMHPIGMRYTRALLPNLPYANATGAVVSVFHLLSVPFWLLRIRDRRALLPIVPYTNATVAVVSVLVVFLQFPSFCEYFSFSAIFTCVRLSKVQRL